MPLPENDVVRLRHMLDAGEQALLFEGLPPLAVQLRAALQSGLN